MPGWAPTGNLNTAREGHTATLLRNGTVLAHGGINLISRASLNISELFHPSTGTWTDTGSSFYPRSFHTATLLGNGKVLVAGGRLEEPLPPPLQPGGTELYDPATGRWAVTATLNQPRPERPAATLLSDGRVLIVGGILGTGNFTDYGSAEIYDPQIGSWTPTGSLVDGRSTGTATLLMDGRVLAVGGFMEPQLYDPATGSWTLTGSLRGYVPNGHTATRLNDGTVLVAGGYGVSSVPQVHITSVNNVELYDPTTEAWSIVGGLNVGRFLHTATLLPNGQVLVVGGVRTDDTGAQVSLESTELYEPATRTWLLGDELGTRRVYHTETLLPVRRPERPREFTVLVAGGDDRTPSSTANTLSSAELYSGVPLTTR